MSGTDRTEFLMLARRIHNALRRAIEDGDGRSDDEWLKKEKPRFAHNVSAMYLISCLAYMEGLYGDSAWSKPGKSATDFDQFIKSHPKDNFRKAGVSSALLEALVCVRNAVVHNGADIAENRDRTCVAKVKGAKLAGVSLSGSIITLESTSSVDFMCQVRLSLVAVAQYHGDG